VYAGFGNADGFNAASRALMRGASDGCPFNKPCRLVPEPHANWFLQTAATPVYSMSGCEQMGMGYSHPPTDHCWNALWNVANASMRAYFVERLIKPLAEAPMIDGVFFDCFNYAYSMPTPWNRNVSLLEPRDPPRSLWAQVPMFSNAATFTNHQSLPIWLNESRLLAGLEGTHFQLNYEFVRAEKMASSGQLENMLRESELAVPVGMHVYYKSASEDPTPHIAVFMLLRNEHW
ncbi:MAG: hypothetical protein SGPRY_004164, partial [Prymnesium sp.]